MAEMQLSDLCANCKPSCSTTTSTTIKRPIIYEEGYVDEKPLESTDHNDRRKQVEAIVPVFIGQIYKSEILGHITSFGAPTRLVVILGILTRIEQQDKKLTYYVRDDTGSIKCIKWLGRHKKSNPKMECDTYIKVHGVLRVEDDRRCILIVNCFKMKSLNELTCHMLEILNIAIVRSEGKKKDHWAEKSLVKKTDKKKKLAKRPVEWKDQPLTHRYGLSQHQLIIYNIVKQRNWPDYGVSRSEVISTAPEVLKQRVNEILDFLLYEEHIYTTCSDDHFRVIYSLGIK